MAESIDETYVPRRDVRIGSASAYTLAAQVFGLATSFVASILIARALGPAGKGQLTVLQQVPALLIVALNMGISAGNTYFVGSRRHSVSEVMGNSLAAAAVLGAVGVPFALLFTTGPLAVVEGIPVAAAIGACILLPLTLAASFIAAINTGLGEMKSLARTQMAGAVLSVAVIVIAYLAHNLTVTAAIAAAVLSAIVVLGLNAGRLFKQYVKRLSVRIAHMREAAGYSIQAYVGNLAGYLNYRADIFIVGYLAGAASVGVYSIAVTFAELLWYVPNAIGAALMPKNLASDDATSAEFTARSARVSSLILLAIGALFAAVLVPLIRLLYGTAFAGAYGAFLLLLPGVFLASYGKVLGPFTAARGHLYPHVAVSSAVVNIGLNLLLVPVLDYRGAALASSLSYTWGAVASLWIFRKHSGLRLKDVLVPTAQDVRTLVSASKEYYIAGLRAVRRRG